jgi:ferric-dicitrate binding protein FerR (iron transport regulator)
MQRFLAGECSADEAREIRQWAGDTPEGVALADVVRDIVRDGTSASSGGVNAERLWEGLRVRLHTAGVVAKAVGAGEVRRGASHMSRLGLPRLHQPDPASRRMMWSAGFVAFVLAIGLAVFPRLSRRANPTVRTYATSIGEQAVVTLDDGTIITLAPTSVLRLDEGGPRTRTVSLTGEAYFQVTHATRVPFLVRTGSVTTRVLGTTFDVRHYTTDRETQVAVTTGKVVVSASGVARPSVTLAAGMTGLVSDSTARMTSTDSASRSMAWTRGMLVFHDVAATEVLAALSRWYGYQFRVTDSALMVQVVTAEFSTRSSSEALGNLGSLLNAEVTVDGNVVTLRADRRPHRSGQEVPRWNLPLRERNRREIVNPKTSEVGR